MKRFRFHLQSLLKLRRFQEEAAQRALGEALRQAQAQRDGIRELEDERAEMLNTATEQESFLPAERQRLSLYVGDLDRRLRAARENLLALESVVAQKREALQTASKARKALEKLRDRRRETFAEERRRRDYANVDEAVLQRFGRDTAMEASGS